MAIAPNGQPRQRKPRESSENARQPLLPTQLHRAAWLALQFLPNNLPFFLSWNLYSLYYNPNQNIRFVMPQGFKSCTQILKQAQSRFPRLGSLPGCPQPWLTHPLWLIQEKTPVKLHSLYTDILLLMFPSVSDNVHVVVTLCLVVVICISCISISTVIEHNIFF